MKVGDLVELSSYGKKVKRTSWIRDGDIGIISKIKGPTCGWYYYEVLWNNSNFSNRRMAGFRTNLADHDVWLDRRDLKFAKMRGTKNESR
jgi:hypothetical protein